MLNIVEVIKRLRGISDEEVQRIDQELNKRIPKKARTKLERELDNLYKTSPRIALIGKTGVGKSSTINSLFDPKPLFRVGHVKATTKQPKQKVVKLGDRGKIIVVDFPGLGESIKADDKYIPLYKDLLHKCDVALWIVKADDRALAPDQRFLQMTLTPDLRDRLIVGINQIDQIQPGKWIENYNVPSDEQEYSIKQKVKDVERKLKEINIRPRQIIPYSALMGYDLFQLFYAMLKACPSGRAWVLEGRAHITPYLSPALES